jgi:hypothetical protein
MFFDSDVPGQVLFICDISITQGSNPITAGSGTINARNINVAGSGINTTYASISTNAWCPPMSNSSTTGSPAANYSPTGPSISSLGGSAPAMVTPTDITAPTYVNGMFTPSRTGATVSISAVSVSDVTPESIINYSGVGSVPTNSTTYSAPAVYVANPNSPNVVLSTLGAKQPADAYKFNDVVYEYYKNTAVSYSYDHGWDGLNRTDEWTIYSSGIINFNMEGNNDGDDNEVHINFETGGNDMHILLAQGKVISWGNDDESVLEIRGGGRVFLYLVGNNLLHFDDGWKIGSTSTATQSLFIIALGGGNRFMSDRNRIMATIYMPSGEDQVASFVTGRNEIQVESDEPASETGGHEIRGITVADYVKYRVYDDGVFRFYKEDGSIGYGLPDYITFNGQSRPLSYFLVNQEEENNYNYSWEEIDTYMN